MMGLVTHRMSENEWHQLAGLLYRYAETELDQSGNWRLDTCCGPVWLSVRRELAPDWPDEAFDPLPRPGASRETGRFADVSGAGQVASREDVQRVIAQLRADLAGRGSQEWENPALDRYLEALEAVLHSLPARLAHEGRPEPAQPGWALIAQILIAATGYE